MIRDAKGRFLRGDKINVHATAWARRYLDGQSYDAIAREYGVDRSTVHRWLTRLGVPPRSRRKRIGGR